MGLETRRVSETGKPTEEIKQEFSAKDMKRLIDSLPIDDIDQQWVKDNESKELSFSTPNQKDDNNQRVQNVFAQMEGIGTFGKNARSSGISSKEFIELNGSKPQTITPHSQELVSQTENISSKPAEIKNTLPTNSEHPVQPPKNNPVSPTKEELNNRIEKKYNSLLSGLLSLYNSEVINQEANAIRGDLQSLINIEKESLEELIKVDNALNSLISRFAKLSQKAEEIKTADDFRINEQQKQLNFLRDYQNQLQGNYGKYWFGKMSEQEKQEYISLYSAAHRVPRKVVEKQIEDSIVIAYNEIVSSIKQSSEQQQKQQFKDNYENMIRFNGRQALETLKQIHFGLGSATPEQVVEFNYLYSDLSTLSKMKPTNSEEEQQKLTHLYDLTDRINKLQSSMSKPNGKTR